MKGDFTRLTHAPGKHYTRVLKQQGRVDLDADWNEAVEISTWLDRTTNIDVIGRCGVPRDSNGFRIEVEEPGGGELLVSPGRIYVDGILCDRSGAGTVRLTEQPELPDYLSDEADPTLEDDATYLVYLDLWERHVTYVEDPEIREVALGGPDTTTRTRTVAQVRIRRLEFDAPLTTLECVSFAPPESGTLTARTEPEEDPANPCAVPAGGGYRGLENRLYRVEIHDDGRDASGAVVRTPTFKWSRDNGSVVLPIVDGGIDGDAVTLARLGHDEVLTVKEGDWVEVLGEKSELRGGRGTLAQVDTDGVDTADLVVTLTEDASAHAAEERLKLRRWDHFETDDVALVDGALPIQGAWFELEDGVQIRFDTAAEYRTGDFWLIPARTREGAILWPRDETDPSVSLPQRPRGVTHHHCSLALARRVGGVWAEVRDCRPLFPPLTDLDAECCCACVHPGEDIQQAIDTVVAAGGGTVCLCAGVHVVEGPLRIENARAVRIHGEGTATLVRFAGSDESGDGGLVIERSERIAVEDLLLAGDDLSSLVDVRPGGDWESCREVALRRLVLLNWTPAGERDLPCAVRLSHAEGVTIDECRAAAEAGVLALWGPRLPDLGDLPTDDGVPGLRTVDFETLPADREIRVGESFTTSGVSVTAEPFEWSGGQTTADGFARVETGGDAGGTGQELQVNNINLRFEAPEAMEAVQISFGEFGGNVNLRVNGDHRNVQAFSEIDGQTVGGVRVELTMEDDERERGLLRLVRDSQPIASFAIGGQELWIDDVVLRGGGGPAEPVEARYGSGVSGLEMRRTAVRFLDLGVAAMRAERWTLDGVDLQPLEEEGWRAAAERFAGAADGQEPGGPAALPRYSAALDAVDALFAGTTTQFQGTALLGVLWRECDVRHSTLAGRRAADVWWWIRGSAHDNRLRAAEAGLGAFWAHACEWSHNTVDAASGVALAFAGCHRLRAAHNRVRGSEGLANLPFGAALAGLGRFLDAAVRGYGGDDPPSETEALSAMIEDSVDLTGLRPLVGALQERLDDVLARVGLGSTPLTVLLASQLLGSIRRPTTGAAALPIIDLQALDNDLACDDRCVALEGFVPLGALGIRGNRVHTVTGQAVRLETHPSLANPHLVARTLRTLLEALGRWAEAPDDDGDDGAMDAVRRELRTLVERWRTGAESFFDLDFRVEGNTVRSLRTAIESNLYGVSVLDNHVTLQERRLGREAGPGTGMLYGTVRAGVERFLPGATVQVQNTQLGATTNAEGRFRLPSVPPGTHRVIASFPGLSPAAVDVTVEAGEQVELRFTLSGMNFAHEGIPSQGMIVSRQGSGVASNPEILDLVEALETSDALEPFAVALRDGAHTDPDRYAEYLAGGPLTDAEARDDAADAASMIAGRASEESLRLAASALGETLRSNDGMLRERLADFIRGLQRYVDSVGVLAKGVGGRISRNEVLVPADASPETEALGGIQLSVRLEPVAHFAAVSGLMLRALMGDTGANDPLLGVTDTLVDDNRVVGGVGHGISVLGLAGSPELLQDLHIRGNHVEGLAGAGIHLNENALVVGVEIAGNRVVGCGREAGFASTRGGIVLHTATLCTLHGNEVARCGEGQTAFEVWGVDLDTVYGLQATDNVIRANGSDEGTADEGGMRLQEVYGSVALHDNVLEFNRGAGLSWANSARPGEEALLPDFLMEAVSQVLRSARRVSELPNDEQASVRDNVLRSSEAADLPLFHLLNLGEVAFTGNTCQSTATVPLGEIQMVTRGIVASNLLRAAGEVSIAVKKMTEGAVLGNVGDRPIRVEPLSASVRHDLNVPAVV